MPTKGENKDTPKWEYQISNRLVYQQSIKAVRAKENEQLVPSLDFEFCRREMKKLRNVCFEEEAKSPLNQLFPFSKRGKCGSDQMLKRLE